MRLSRKKWGFILLFIGTLFLSGCQTLFGPTIPTIIPRATNSNPTRTLAPTSTALPTFAATATPTTMPTLAITPSGPATCQTAPILPVIDTEMDEKIPNATDQDWMLGADSARLTIYEYSDFQCQICIDLGLNLHQLQTLYPDDVRIVYRYLPLSKEHDKADLAQQAAEAAGLQDSFWAMHDLLFSKQDEWITLSVKEFSDWLIDQAVALDLDKNQFSADLISDTVVKRVFNASQETAITTLSVPPAVFFNKSQYQDWVDLSTLINMVEYYKLPDKAFSECPEQVIDPNKQYTATFTTSYGDIIYELYPKQAPVAVNSFVFLARQKWYDNSTFFRVIPGFLAQGGDPSGSGNGRPGYAFSNEVTPELRFNQAGMLAMSNYGEGTNGSQFFITYTEIPEFDGNYTIFGKVIEGMDVLKSLRPRNPSQDQVLLPADLLISVIVEEK